MHFRRPPVQEGMKILLLLPVLVWAPPAALNTLSAEEADFRG